MTDSNARIMSKTDELERRLNELERTMAHGFMVVADTEGKINAYTNLQMVLIVIALVAAFAAIVLAVVI